MTVFTEAQCWLYRWLRTDVPPDVHWCHSTDAALMGHQRPTDNIPMLGLQKSIGGIPVPVSPEEFSSVDLWWTTSVLSSGPVVAHQWNLIGGSLVAHCLTVITEPLMAHLKNANSGPLADQQ